MKYCFNAIYFTGFIFVNSVVVSSIISCNNLYQDFIIMYVWYFVSRNSISVLGAIWPSLSPCTVINPILLTYQLDHIVYIVNLITCKTYPIRCEPPYHVFGCISHSLRAKVSCFMLRYTMAHAVLSHMSAVLSVKTVCNNIFEVM